MIVRRWWLRTLIALSFGGLVATTPLLMRRAQAADQVITVTTFADSGAGSLREAIALVNAAGAGNHQIQFANSLAGQEIDLSTNLPLIQANVTINGAGA